MRDKQSKSEKQDRTTRSTDSESAPSTLDGKEKNRGTMVGLTGEETEEELAQMADEILQKLKL